MVGCCSVFSFFASSSGPIKLPQNDSGIFTKDKCIFCNISKGEGFDVITEVLRAYFLAWAVDGLRFANDALHF
jgi:hypothetical protein